MKKVVFGWKNLSQFDNAPSKSTFQVKKNEKEMSTTPGIPRRSPIQVLTGLDAA